ncbi:hypothetical protein VTO42DRAFT_600 [Malbranchea cinnamomea]
MMGKSFDVPAQAQSPSKPLENRKKRQRYRFVHCYDTSNNTNERTISVPSSLLDPVFQDLDPVSRYYVSHFANILCQSLVIYDVPSHNPYRSLISLSKDHELLRHVLIANSAIEVSNILSIPPGSRRTSTLSLPLLPGPVPYCNLGSEKEILARVRRDALMAKQKTLQMLREALNDIDKVGRDVVLTCILLAINFELVSSGKDEWKVHVEGATRLIDYLGILPSNASRSTMSSLRDYVVSDCIIYYILGSMLSPPRSYVSAIHSSVDVLSILERAEANSYMSCPAVLLQIMLSASLLSGLGDGAALPGPEHLSTAYRAEQAFHLMQKAQSFDVHQWAASVQGVASYGDFEGRVHVALAHRSAVCLYINRAAPFAGLLDEQGVEEHVRTVTRNLSFIRPGDPLHKGTSWPMFIAGAESEDPEQQAWVVEALYMLWETLPWGYVQTAVEMLETIWRLKDSSCNTPAKKAGSWLQEFKALGNDWIVV